MTVVADAVLKEKREVIDVIPHTLSSKEFAHYGLTELHLVSSMHQKGYDGGTFWRLYRNARRFVAPSTNFFEIVTWAQLGLHTKPIGLLNVGGYFDLLLKFVDYMLQERFISAEHRQLIITSHDPEELLLALIRYKPSQQIPKVIDWKETKIKKKKGGGGFFKGEKKGGEYKRKKKFFFKLKFYF